MIQVVIQSAVRQLKSKLRLPPPNKEVETENKSESKDRTGLILILGVGGSLLLLAIFSNLPTS